MAPVEERRKHDCSSQIGAQFSQSWSASHWAWENSCWKDSSPPRYFKPSIPHQGENNKHTWQQREDVSHGEKWFYVTLWVFDLKKIGDGMIDSFIRKEKKTKSHNLYKTCSATMSGTKHNPHPKLYKWGAAQFLCKEPILTPHCQQEPPPLTNPPTHPPNSPFSHRGTEVGVGEHFVAQIKELK